jgi:Ca2+-binding RTX toxin-like protein
MQIKNGIKISSGVTIEYPIFTPSIAETFTVTSSGFSAYIINSFSNPNLNLLKGETYQFNISSPGHPFWIKTTAILGTGNAYSTGVTNNGTQNGIIMFTVPINAPNTLYYICQFHGSMQGIINLT